MADLRDLVSIACGDDPVAARQAAEALLPHAADLLEDLGYIEVALNLAIDRAEVWVGPGSEDREAWDAAVEALTALDGDVFEAAEDATGDVRPHCRHDVTLGHRPHLHGPARPVEVTGG